MGTSPRMENPMTINLHFTDDRYPLRVKKSMGDIAPGSLEILGNMDILRLRGVGFGGSRKSSEEGLAMTRDYAKQVSECDLSVVSGNANGVDCKAHFTCLAYGGRTILVLPEGINHFRIKDELYPVWDWDRVLVISQFRSDARWEASRAMARNRLVIALSSAMIVVEPGEKGGTLNVGKQTLKAGLPLFVAQSEALGNQILLDMGAREIKRSKNMANLEEVFAYTS